MLRCVDRFALLRYGGPHPLGLYALGLMATGLTLYLPEAAGYVLFPRVAAAFHGDGDRARVRHESRNAHRSLAVLVPLIVGIGMLWADPVTARVLPAYCNVVA